MGSFILVTGSMAWIIIWSAFAFKMAKNHINHLDKLGELARAGKLAEFWATFDAQAREKFAHSHATTFACVSMLVGLAMPLGFIGYGPDFQLLLAVWMLAGVVLASFGALLRAPQVLAPGNILFITALIASFVGIWI